MSLRFVLGRVRSMPREEYYHDVEQRQMEEERRYRPQMVGYAYSSYHEPMEENMYGNPGMRQHGMGFTAPMHTKPSMRREDVESIARAVAMEMMEDVKEELKQELGSAKSMSGGLLKEAEEVLRNPPKTWSDKDPASILRMEMRELDQALSSGKSVSKEAKHVMAALLRLED